MKNFTLNLVGYETFFPNFGELRKLVFKIFPNHGGQLMRILSYSRVDIILHIQIVLTFSKNSNKKKIFIYVNYFGVRVRGGMKTILIIFGWHENYFKYFLWAWKFLVIRKSPQSTGDKI